ncbi:MAG: hypothetical protein K6E95_02325 [Lachnospiraceae bacterium]|nr:hypothetical protein [Lachnospiraceae bacterium]
MTNLTGVFKLVQVEATTITSDVAQTPASFSPTIFSMIKNISETVIMPIAGLILTFIACYELIQLIIEHNNLANFETWIFMKWIIKTFIAVTIITHTFDITMAIFDVAQNVVAQAGGIIVTTAGVNTDQLTTLAQTVNAMSNGALFGLYLQTGVVTITLWVLSKIVFVIVYARMIEIYLMTSLAPIPLATFGNKEQSQIGQNYLRSLAALAFQGFLIIVCVGIYAVLIKNMTFSSDVSDSIWGIVGYTVLLCFTLFKTGTLAKSIFSAH